VIASQADHASIIPTVGQNGAHFSALLSLNAHILTIICSEIIAFCCLTKMIMFASLIEDGWDTVDT
jgi:hypothetical protein